MITGHGKGCGGCFCWMYRLHTEKAFVKHSFLSFAGKETGAQAWGETCPSLRRNRTRFSSRLRQLLPTDSKVYWNRTWRSHCTPGLPSPVPRHSEQGGRHRPQAASKAKRSGLSRAGEPRTLSGTAGQGSPRVQSHLGLWTSRDTWARWQAGSAGIQPPRSAQYSQRLHKQGSGLPTHALRNDPEDITAPRPLLPGLLLTLLLPRGTELHFKNFSEFPWSPAQLSLCILPAPWPTLRHCLPCHAVDAMEGRTRSGHPVCVSTVHRTKEILSDVQLLNCGQVQQRSWDFPPSAHPTPGPSHTQLRSVCPRLIYSSS